MGGGGARGWLENGTGQDKQLTHKQHYYLTFMIVRLTGTFIDYTVTYYGCVVVV